MIKKIRVIRSLFSLRFRFFRMIWMKDKSSRMRYFPMRPPIVSLCLYSDSRAQGLGDSSCIPKDRGKQLEGKKEIGKKRKRRKRNEMKSYFYPKKEIGLSGEDSTPPLLKKQRGYSQRLP
jgi:hypothetical protein